VDYQKTLGKHGIIILAKIPKQNRRSENYTFKEYCFNHLNFIQFVNKKFTQPTSLYKEGPTRALRVVFIELEWGVWLYGGHHAGGEEAGGRLHVLESLLLVQQRRQLDPRNKAARQQ